MYGLVNKAIQDLVISTAGESAWEQIKLKAGHPDLVLDVTINYDDQLSLNLVTAASDLLEIPVDTLLEAFGRHWVLYTNREGWLLHFRFHGDDFLSCLMGLDEMHYRVKDAMPDGRMPLFSVSNDGDSYYLDYVSHREGFAPMVIGVLKALSEQFNETWHIELLTEKRKGVKGERFLMKRAAHTISDDQSRAA